VEVSNVKSQKQLLAAVMGGSCLLLFLWADRAPTQSKAKPDVGKTTYDQISPVILGQETFEQMMAKDKAGKDAIMTRQKHLLEERYDLTVKTDPTVTMSRGKPIPVGPTARLGEGMTWDKLGALSADDIKTKGIFPKGYMPLPHPNHPAGGMVFPQKEVKELPRLVRFDLE
jgi:hypothetical protein